MALPFLVLALQCVLCPLTGNFFLCLRPLYVPKSVNLFILSETSLLKSPSTLCLFSMYSIIFKTSLSVN